MPAFSIYRCAVIKLGHTYHATYADERTAEFSNCNASANYRSGINFGVVVSEKIAWTLAFSHPNWSLTSDQKFPIVLSFDDRSTFT